MAEQDNESRSSLSSDGAELSIGDDSVSSSSDESADMKDLTTASGSEDFSTRNNVAVSHSDDDSDMPAKTFPFLKLPPELRMRVYYYVFYFEHVFYYKPRDGDKEVDVNLLHTCRQIYQEARYEIFKCNTFYFYDSWTADWATLLPDQKSAIRSIIVGLDPESLDEFFPHCESLCKFISDFQGLSTANIRMMGFWAPENWHQRVREGFDGWKEGVTILQTLGTIHWRGDICSPDFEGSPGVIQGSFVLRIGHQQGLLGKPDADGVSGNGLRLLYWNRWVSWQGLWEEGDEL